MRIETPRLILRSPKKEDWKDILEGAREIEVTKMLAVVPHPYNGKDAKEYVSRTIKKWKEKKKKDYTFFIELKSEKKVIGVTSMHGVDDFNGKATTGSWLNKRYWRQGYIIEAKIPVLDFAFKELKLRKLETSAFAVNKASNSMSKKLGFKFEGRKRKSVVCKATGIIHDENIYGLFKEEWIKIKGELIKQVKKRIENDKRY